MGAFDEEGAVFWTGQEWETILERRGETEVLPTLRELNRALRILGERVQFDRFGEGLNLVTDQLPVTETALTADTTLDDTYRVVLVDASGGAVTITLPAADLHSGRIYDVKKIDSSANAVTVDGNGSETIDDATTQTLSSQYASLRIISDGTEWWIL